MARLLSRSVLIAVTVAGALSCEGFIDRVPVSPIGEQPPPGGIDPSNPDPQQMQPPPEPPPIVPPAGEMPVPAAPAVFTCNAAQTPDELPLPRLSRIQYEATLRFAIARANAAQADAIWAQVAPVFDRVPKDQHLVAPGDLKGGYARLDQSIQQTQVDASFDVAKAIAAELTSTTARVGTLLGGCATDADTANDRACLEAFLRGWGARVLRAPLPAADVTFFADVAGTTPVERAAVADVLTVVLTSPRFLYRVEHGTQDSQPVSALSAYELAARLSFQLWQSPPDDALWAAAQDGSLLTTAGYDAQLKRLLASPKLADSINEFVNDWLRLEELPSLTALKNDPVFKAFSGTPMAADADRTAMLDDVRRSLLMTLQSGGTVRDFLRDSKSYASTNWLAEQYGVTAWNGTAMPPRMPSANRVGLLTRAAMLATGTASTRPIHRGYLVRNALLCQQVGAPPANVGAMPPAPTAEMTTRQSVTALTSGGTCGACHNGIINPQGFVLEGFDALGRERTHEKLFDAQGNLTNTRELDTTAKVFVYGSEWRETKTPAELTQLIDDSRLLESCFARHYFRFAQSRVESNAKDSCALAELETAARSGAPMQGVLESFARQSTFRSRRF